MSTPEFPDIPVTAAEIIRQVGHNAYSRGQAYMRGGNVARYSYDQEQGNLTGQVTGSKNQLYSTSIFFLNEKSSHYSFRARCSCPVGNDCKHAVALMLTAIDQSSKAKRALTASSTTWRPGQQEKNKQQELEEFGLFTASQLTTNPSDSKIPAWQRTLSHSLAARPSNYTPPSRLVSGGLDLKLTVPAAFGYGSQRSRLPQAQLQARPLMQGSRNKWIKGGLSWEDFQRDLTRSTAHQTIYPEHAQWFAEFYSIVRPWQSTYSSHRDWVSLSTPTSTLLWEVLWRAKDISLPLLLDGKPISYDIADATNIHLTAHQNQGDITLTPVLSWDGYDFPAAHCHPLGDPRTGFLALGGAAHRTYRFTATQAQWANTRNSAIETAHATSNQHELPHLPDLLFLPLTEALPATADQLANHGPLTIPQADTQDFYQNFYARLARALPITSRDPQLTLPQLGQAQLVLTLTHLQDQAHTTKTSWHWEYPTDPLNPNQEPLTLPALGYPGDDHDLRDTSLEHELYKQIRTLAPDLPFTKHTYTEWATRDLLHTTLPALRQLKNLRIDTQGTPPTFQEVADTDITVTLEETTHRDWFGLGIAIKAGDWYVPFTKIFEALNAGQTHMLLGNGAYFPLDKPHFQKLAELIREAHTLDDASGPLRISRHQAGLWEELEELAADVHSVESWDRQVSALLTLHTEEPPAAPSTLNATLRPYQLEGYQWLTFCWEHELGGVLADDMGLGKTLQTIALISYAKERAEERQEPFTPFLVVAPTSVVPNWVQEIKKFAPNLAVTGITETQNKSQTPLAQLISGQDVIVTSYALFRLDQDAYLQAGSSTPWNGLILDEAQFVKNAKSKAHKVARDLPARFKLAVTGTPMENNLMELWSMFSIVAPGLFPSARAFKDYYARPIESGEETQALAKLRARVRPLMKRRTKDLVAPDLPSKTEQRINVPLAPAHRRAYDKHLQRERQKILGLLKDLDRNRFTIFQSLTTLRRLALDATLIDPEKYEGVPSSKLDYLEENLPEIIAEGHRALIFSQFTGYLRIIAQRLDHLGIPYLYLDGSTRDRSTLLQDFQAGKAPVFLISLKAGGFGLNLTSADYCFIMDPWWNPAAEQQAVDRIHRIGQTKKVMVYRLVSAGTIEEKVMELKDSKAALFDAVVDEGQFFSTQLTAEQVRDLLTAQPD